MFIVLEGIDGSGKSTQIQLLKEALERQGKSVQLFDFPRYQEPSSFFVTKFLNGEYGDIRSPKLISLFFALDRFDASRDILEALDKYDYVLSNRYVSSNMIHQSGKILEGGENFSGVDTFVDWIEDTEFGICGIPRPDTIYFLDVPPEISFGLIDQKNQRDYIKSGNKDINEQNQYHQTCAYKAALYLAEKYHWKRITCSQNGQLLSPSDISKKLLETIF